MSYQGFWVTAVGLVVFVAGLVAQAPAAWLDLAIARFSQGAVRLAAPSGTVWSGHGQLLLVPGRVLASDSMDGGARLAAGAAQSQATEVSAGQSDRLPDTAALVLVERIDWQLGLDFWPLRVSLRLGSQQLAGPIAQRPIVFSAQEILVPDGRLTLPWLDLSHAQGALAIARAQFFSDIGWQNLGWSGQGLSPQAQITMHVKDLGVGLSAIRPLGSYQVLVSSGPLKPARDGQYQALAWQLSSLGDPVLHLSGSGQFSQSLRGRIEMACRRNCDFVVGLLSVMGKKNGEIYELVLGG
ncbi:MAG: hypothetical protein ACO3WN_05165 [Burkholderiaceae bacterium]